MRSVSVTNGAYCLKVIAIPESVAIPRTIAIEGPPFGGPFLDNGRPVFCPKAARAVAPGSPWDPDFCRRRAFLSFERRAARIRANAILADFGSLASDARSFRSMTL
jgi:hypothetical protein